MSTDGEVWIAMEKRITATKAVRDFSELLNTIKFKGDRYIIERSGKPVALMTPIPEATKIRTLKELKSLLRELPSLDDDRDAFAKDVEDIIASGPPLPKEGVWE